MRHAVCYTILISLLVYTCGELYALKHEIQSWRCIAIGAAGHDVLFEQCLAKNRQ